MSNVDGRDEMLDRRLGGKEVLKRTGSKREAMTVKDGNRDCQRL